MDVPPLVNMLPATFSVPPVKLRVLVPLVFTRLPPTLSVPPPVRATVAVPLLFTRLPLTFTVPFEVMFNVATGVLVPTLRPNTRSLFTVKAAVPLTFTVPVALAAVVVPVVW